MSKVSVFNEISDQIKECKKCVLCQKRIQAVPGAGSLNAEIMFVGEGPGKNEDEQGMPFVGQAGKLLDELLLSIGLKREDVFITNIVKCRPPDNRDPLDEEKQTCSPYLDKQIDIIKPLVIVTLGRHSMNYFLPMCKISLDHGRAKRLNGKVFYPVYHPAAALYTGSLKKVLLEDFKKIPQLIELIKSGE